MLNITSSTVDTTIFAAIAVIVLGTIGALIFFLINKIDQVKELQEALKKLKLSFNSLDEQAKLILKTDLELNRAQEELDRRLASLDALQRTSRLISTTLDEEEIFRRLDKSLMLQLGFERILVLTFDEEKNLRMRVNTGFSNDKIAEIGENLLKDTTFNSVFQEGYSLSSATASKQKKEKAASVFGIQHFILAPILTQDGTIGAIFVGNQTETTPVSEADEEMVSILTNQIGQSLENAKLFEEVYKSRQELELKIQDRTRQLALALEKVQKISRTKSEFVSAVSHELRTPLTSIKGYAAILMSGKLGDIPDKVKERLEKINKHSDSLVELINDLLDIARIESGRVEMKFEKVNLKMLIENMRDLLMPQMREKNITFVADVAEDLPLILADSKQMERVFINLLSNAIKYTPKGTITVRASGTDQEVSVEVQDTGAGMREEDLPKLFTEFYRVENELNQNIKGTGLGLALVRNIINAHQGTIGVTSKLGAGTTFHFTVPLEPPKPETTDETQGEKTAKEG
jgi:signal transduction histidine kinase